MREIKFRAWDTGKRLIFGKSDGWVHNTRFHLKLNGELYDSNLPDKKDHLKDLIPMQYTGLKDKNGKELYYDSDLIKLPGSDKVWMAIKDRFDIPVFMADQGITIVDFRDYFMERPVDAFEIIGTQQENPELLGEAAKRPEGDND
jgi:hypothetical protein